MKKITCLNHKTSTPLFYLLLLTPPILANINTPTALEEITIIADPLSNKTIINPDTKKLFSIAGAANDPIQAIYALPGVTFSTGWQTSDPVIRGSAPRDNAYYMDGIPAEYLFHVFGTSIFNKNVIRTFDLKAAAFTGFYTNAIGGIIDVKLRAPKNQPFNTTLNWSFLQTGFFVESGIGEQHAFYASYRKSLLQEYDALIDLKKLASEGQEGFSIKSLPADQDYQFKHQWQVADDQTLTFSAAGARDDLAAEFSAGNNLVERDPDFAGTAAIHKGFDNQGIQWQREDTQNAQMFSVQLFHIDNFDRSSFGQDQSRDIHYHNYLLRSDWQKSFRGTHTFATRFWVESINYSIKNNAKVPPCDQFSQVECPTIDIEKSNFIKKFTTTHPALYISDKMKLGKNQYLTIAINAIYDSHLKESRIEPRIGWDYFLNESWAVYLKTGLYSQRPEILQMIDPVGNTDLTTERSTHYLGGVEYSLTANYSLRTEFYYKTLEQLVVNISALSPERIYSNQARGSAYGVELLFNKNLTDKWYGWASIGLSKTQRTNLATQQDMPFKYDKPIIINLVGNYALTDRWTIGAKWNLQSGGRYTPIIDLQENKRFKGTFDPVYGKLNTERLPFYHQLDIRVEYSRKKPWGYWTFYTDLLNAYHKKNITEYRYAPNKKDTIKTPKGFNENVPVTASTSLGIIPSIGFEINF